jgi:Protein of unknown function (DUF3014)
MRADPEEYVPLDTRRSRVPVVELLLAVAIIAGLLIFWFWTNTQDKQKPAATIAEAPPVAVAASPTEIPATPDIPQRSEPATVVLPDTGAVAVDGNITTDPTDPTGSADATPLTPQDGDELLRKQLSAAGAKPILLRMLSEQQPLEVSAALIDGLGNGVILRKFLSGSLHSERFSVVTQDDGIFMSPASYLRYDAFADAIAALDIDTLVSTFHLLRPVYEQVYGYLGLNPDDFDNAVIRTLDKVLATPEIGEPIALKPKSVMYLYAAPALEGLPEVQKQLLRMGPDNIRRIKQQAQLLRDGLLAQ